MVIDLLVHHRARERRARSRRRAVAKSQKPDVVKQVDELNDADQRPRTRPRATPTRRSAPTRRRTTPRSRRSIRRPPTTPRQKAKDLTKQRDDEQAKLAAATSSPAIAIAFFLGFLYLAIPTAITGPHAREAVPAPEGRCARTVRRSAGRVRSPLRPDRARHLRALSTCCNRSPRSIVLFGVTMWMRNPNMQGLHDRFAHTIVVSDAADDRLERFVDVGARLARSTSTRSKRAAATRSTCSAARARTSPR